MIRLNRIHNISFFVIFVILSMICYQLCSMELEKLSMLAHSFYVGLCLLQKVSRTTGVKPKIDVIKS